MQKSIDNILSIGQKQS